MSTRTTTFAHLIAEGILEIGDGYRAQNSELGGSGPLFLRAGHVTDTHIDFAGVERFHAHLAHAISKKLSRPGDVIVTTKGNSTGRTAYVGVTDPEFVYSPHLSYWRSLKPSHLCSGYLRYWSRSPAFQAQLRGLSVSTDMAPYLSLADQKRLSIELPDIDTQRAIAKVLGTLDDKIELNRRMKETLEAMARAIFKDWFVDFGPTQSKIEGRDRYLDKDTWSLFPAGVDSTGVPRGWTAGTLQDLSNLNPESWARQNYPTRVQYVDLTSTKWGVIERVEAYDRDDAPSRAQRVLRAGDTIVGTVRPGNGSYSLVSEPNLTGSTGFAVLRPITRDAREFVYLAATRRSNIERLASLADGAAYPAVRPEQVAETEVIIPNQDVLGAFSRITSSTFERIGAANRESKTLVELRDTLLPRLISNEIRTTDVDVERAIR